MYNVLRVASIVYKALAFILIFVILGAIGYLAGDARKFGQPLEEWATGALSILIGGGLMAFTMFVLAQLIDVQVATTRNVNQVAKDLKALRDMLTTEQQANTNRDKNITVMLEHQTQILNRLSTKGNQDVIGKPEVQTQEQRQAQMESAKIQLAQRRIKLEEEGKLSD
jgi:hypothetical protein